jgi:hypothetical protein
MSASHGGQVESPVGVPTPLAAESACIVGEWTHVRHGRAGPVGTFRTDGFDSFACAALTKACFTGVGDYNVARGRKASTAAVVRVDVEDRSESEGRRQLVDRYRLRLWILPEGMGPDDPAAVALRIAVSCAAGLDEDAIHTSRPPDIDDGGDFSKGNQRISPPPPGPCVP